MLRRSRTPFSMITAVTHTREWRHQQGNNAETEGRKNRTMRDSLNLRGLAHRLVGLTPTLRVDEVRSENSVNEGRLSQSRLA
jgi:hypothetical protein